MIISLKKKNNLFLSIYVHLVTGFVIDIITRYFIITHIFSTI